MGAQIYCWGQHAFVEVLLAVELSGFRHGLVLWRN